MDTAIQIAEDWTLSLEDVEYVPDNLFPTDNDMEVPMLRLDRQPQTIEIPFVLFGEQKRSFKMNGHGTLTSIQTITNSNPCMSIRRRSSTTIRQI